MGLNRVARRGAVVGVLAVAGCVWSGCSGKKATEYVAGVSSQVQVPRDLDTVAVAVTTGGQVSFYATYPVYDGKVRLPKTLGVVNSSTPAGVPITITIAGFDNATTQNNANVAALNGGLLPNTVPSVGTKEQDLGSGGGARILRASRQPYVPGQIIYLPMPLHYSCYDVDCGPQGGNDLSGCGSNIDAIDPCSCVGGQCTAPDVASSTLPPYNDSFTDSTANTCFRVFTDTDSSGNTQPGCLDFGIAPLTLDAANCIYALPDSPSDPPDSGLSNLPTQIIEAALKDNTGKLNAQNLNVRVAFDNYVSEVLDNEGVCNAQGVGANAVGVNANPPAGEGYCTFPNAPQMFQLAPGLCKGTTHKITLLEASAGCPSKTELQPICDDSTQGPPEPPLADGGSSADGGCNVATALTPAPSALYILWDRSTGMRDFFGQGALSQVLGLSLGDPVFKQTQVAFSYTPAPAPPTGPSLDCNNTTSNTYLSPLIPFQPSTQGQVQIANSLLNEGNEDGGVASLEDGGLVLPQGPTTSTAGVPWYPEAALDGAYQSLLNFRGSSKEALNRMAVMMFFDRDPSTNGSTPDCQQGATPTASAAQVAQSYLAVDGIETYVVYLANADYPNGSPPQWGTDAQQLAGGLSSSSKYFFDASNGHNPQLAEETEALALASVVADLGSCVYETNGLGPDAVLSYPDAASLEASYKLNNPAVIQFKSVVNAPSCANDNPPPLGQTTGGQALWVYDHQHIRVCENTCAQIVAAIQADQGNTATINITRAAEGLPPIGSSGIAVSAVEPCESAPIDASIVESGSAPTGYDAGLPTIDASFFEDAGTEDASGSILEDGGTD